MKCTLVRCPQTFGKYVSAAYAVPPIGLAYVAASMVEAGHDVTVVDPTGEAIEQFTPIDGAVDGGGLRRGLTNDEILDRIPPGTEVIGFSLMFSQDWLEARKLIFAVRDRFPKAVLLAGGEHFTSEPAGALETSPLDFVVTGEGDLAVCDLLEHVAGTRPIEQVPGVYYKADGEVRKSAAMVRAKDIDQLPWPAWDLIPIEEYLKGGHGWGVDRGRNMPLNATRGCPYQCTFCSSPTMWTTRWVARSPEDVVKEIEYYAEKYQATNFDFQDLTAIIKKSWVLEFCRLLLAKNLKITWQLPTGTRSEALDEEALGFLYQSGCTNITYAPESGDDATLRRIKKKIDRQKMLDSMRASVRTGCNVKATFIFGFQGDTYRSLFGTFGFLGRMALVGVHDISIAPFRPYPGSELFRQLQEKGVIPKKPDDAYYRRLASTSENLPGAMDTAECFSDDMSAAGLERMRVAALAWFFLLSWAVRPVRIFRLIRALFTERQESRLDKSLIEMKRRVVKSWKKKPGLRLGEINPY